MTAAKTCRREPDEAENRGFCPEFCPAIFFLYRYFDFLSRYFFGPENQQWQGFQGIFVPNTGNTGKKNFAGTNSVFRFLRFPGDMVCPTKYRYSGQPPAAPVF